MRDITPISGKIVCDAVLDAAFHVNNTTDMKDAGPGSSYWSGPKSRTLGNAPKFDMKAKSTDIIECIKTKKLSLEVYVIGFASYDQNGVAHNADLERKRAATASAALKQVFAEEGLLPNTKPGIGISEVRSQIQQILSNNKIKADWAKALDAAVKSLDVKERSTAEELPFVDTVSFDNPQPYTDSSMNTAEVKGHIKTAAEQIVDVYHKFFEGTQRIKIEERSGNTAGRKQRDGIRETNTAIRELGHNQRIEIEVYVDEKIRGQQENAIKSVEVDNPASNYDFYVEPAPVANE
jgi:hypothetical protein